MAIKLEMPKLSDTMSEGTLLRWLKKPGDSVEIGDEIAEIETDKATMTMESFDEGTLKEVLIQEGEKAPVGATLGLLDDGSGDDGEEEEESSEPEAKEEKADSKGGGAKQAAAQAGPGGGRDGASPAAGRGRGGERILASPLARKIAEEKGLDLAAIKGTGPGGRIVRKDVENAEPAAAGAGSGAAGSAAGVAAPARVPVPFKEGDEKVELSTMRRVIADRLLTSKLTIPHFYLHVEVDAGPLMALRKQINAQAEATHGNKYSVNDFVLKAAINALQACPAVNASFNGDHIVRYGYIGISVAIAVEDGLVTPVIKNADEKSLLQISREVKDMAGRAREGKLKPDEYDGGTLTVSNLGAWGIDSFDAIVNPPQSAILSVGSIVEKPVVQNGEVVPGRRMNIGLSGDHRVVDGAVGAEFLAELRKLIENPALMLV